MINVWKWIGGIFKKDTEFDLSKYDKGDTGERFTKRGTEFHSFDGNPALIIPDGTLAWFYDGVLHRDNAPAVVNEADGFEAWYKKGLRHREDGPAITSKEGLKFIYHGYIAMDEQVFFAEAWRKEIHARLAGVGGDGADKMEKFGERE